MTDIFNYERAKDLAQIAASIENLIEDLPEDERTDVIFILAALTVVKIQKQLNCTLSNVLARLDSFIRDIAQ